ncbi:MAG: serine/threonine protein phosphatase [Proteobacteria bacterium]|nr:MAG: serine/threonine protein phosphatase [Pseudomonadota bacterium]
MPKRFFVVGDIHGCPEELAILVQHLEKNEGLSQSDGLLFIGDYVDRGPGSKDVIDFLIGLRAGYPDAIFLKGNHEDMLLSFLGYPGREGMAYLQNGGAECVTSYGIEAGRAKQTTREELAPKVPAEHVQFLRALESYVLTPDFVFAHAGLNPLRDLKHQVDEDLFWIRDEFISNLHYFRKTVVFGHTPYENVLFNLPYKIGIDTGLVYGNKLSCLEVVGHKLLQVPRGKKEVIVKEGAW